MRLPGSRDGITAVSIRLTSSAAMRKFSAVSSMSASASAAYGLPCSSVSACAKSSRRPSIRLAIAWQTSARSQAESAAHFGCAVRAAATAASMSAELASGASAIDSPVTGERIVRTCSPVAATQLPPMKFSSVRTVTATGEILRGRRQAFDRVQGALDLRLVERDVLQLAGEVVVVRRHVEVPVPGKVEENRLLLSGLVRLLRSEDRAVDGVRGLRRRQDPLTAGERERRREDVVLQIRLGPHEPVAHELREERRRAVVAEPTGVNRRRHEVVAERVHRDERGQLARV